MFTIPTLLVYADMQMTIQPVQIATLYQALNQIGCLESDKGFMRSPYSEAESSAMALFSNAAANAGLHSRVDSVGNVIIETPGSYSQWIETGSHLDTVPEGGNYDGAVGVVAGFAAIHHIHTQKIPLNKGLRLRIFRGEESACFGIASIGSRAAFGCLPAKALQHSWQKQRLSDAMISQQADPTPVITGIPALPTSERDSIAAFIELHIEQGKVLEQQGMDIGIVTAIRGSRRSWVILNGLFDHSGATPMGVDYRHDCNLAMAYMQVRLDQLLDQYNGKEQTLVQTIGVINSHKGMAEAHGIARNAVSKISGSAFFSFEVRGACAEHVETYCQKAYVLITETADAFGIRADIDTFSDQPGVADLDHRIQQQIADACKQLNLNAIHLPSGAWHDAGTCAQYRRADGSAIPTGMIFVPCLAGISHSPNEYCSDEQLANGATVLAHTMARLAVS